MSKKRVDEPADEPITEPFSPDPEPDAKASSEGAPAVEAPPADPPLQEYPKMLYIGPYRQQVTVCTAEEEAQWQKTHDEQMAGPSQTKASASVPGVTVLGAPVDAATNLADSDEKPAKRKGDR